MSYMERTCMFDVSLTTVEPAAMLPPAPTQAKIHALEDALRDLPQTPLEPEHYFAEGMYGRELFIPAGQIVVGKTHRHEHLVQLLSGEATIATDKGVERVRGPKTWVSPAGVKRALVTHTDCLFFTFHLNESNTRDLAAIEDYVIDPYPALAQDAPELAELSDALQGVYA